MNTRRTIPFSGLWARVGLLALFTAVGTAGVQAQTVGNSDLRQPQDRTDELRTHTWSIFAQGGLSWATDVWYQDIDAKRSYRQSPAVGGGVDFTIRPWVRVGAEYLWSNYRREQRLAALETTAMPVKTYGNYLMNYHNAKVGVGFNILELWQNRNARWLNIWAGTGVGYTFAKGNEYGIYFSNTKTTGGTTTAFAEGETVSNDGTVTFTANVQTKNRHEDFNTLYLPASLHIEADVSPRFTLGLKGEVDWMMNRKEIAPKNLIFALATVRYNFVPSRERMWQTYYEGEIASMGERLNDLRRELAESKAQADRLENARRQAEQQNDELRRKLSDCAESEPQVVLPSHFVQFSHNSSYMSRAEADRLKAFAQTVRGKKLSLVAEASTPGTTDYNQSLSERRLKRVVDALLEQGFALDDLRPKTAIGASKGKPSAEGRRVTITVE